MHILHAALKTIKAIKSVQFFSQHTSPLFDPSRLALTANWRSTPCRQRGLVDQRGSSTSEAFTEVSVYLLCCQFRMGLRTYVWMRFSFFQLARENGWGSACQRINDARRVFCTFFWQLVTRTMQMDFLLISPLVSHSSPAIHLHHSTPSVSVSRAPSIWPGTPGGTFPKSFWIHLMYPSGT